MNAGFSCVARCSARRGATNVCCAAKHSRVGFSLLEVVLALALAGITMALLAQLVGVANRAASAARDLTKAQLIAESVMAEFASGVMLPQSTSGTWMLDETWEYDAQVETGPSENLYNVVVTVTRAIDDPSPPSFSLTQFLFVPPEPVEEETDTSSTDTGGGV